MKPAHDPDVPAPVGHRRPPKAWRTLRMLVLLCIVAVAMLFVGHRFGDRIGATLRQMWGDLTGGEEGKENYGCNFVIRTAIRRNTA